MVERFFNKDGFGNKSGFGAVFDKSYSVMAAVG